MYHVISTGAAATILYLISYFFSKTGFYSIQYHRKVWNIILTVSFLLTATAGLFLALQITYKWNIVFIKSILKWHVECGIAMAFTGIFHFIWHLSWFKNLFGNGEINSPSEEEIQRTPGQNKLNLVIIGFVSSSVQLLLIREMMNIAGGYELIAGTFLGSWLIASAAGSAMARSSAFNNIRTINLIFSLGPIVTIFLLIICERLFLNPGESPSFLLSVIITLIVLFPFCFVSGFAFIKLISNSQNSKDYSPGRSFSIETAGCVMAGVTVSLLTAGLLNTYQLLLMIISMNFTYVLVSFFIISKYWKIFTSGIMVILAIFLFLINPDIFFRQQLLHGIKVIDSQDTPYGNITKGAYGTEKAIYYDHRLQSYSNDVIEREENIHYAMLQHNNPENILIISGDIRSNLNEISKYNVKKVVYVERDPALINIELQRSDYLSKILTIINDDAFSYIRRTKENFDVVVLLLPPPSTLLLNRFYTTEFFSEVKKKTGSKGVFICSPGSGDNYYNKESVTLYSSVFNSLKQVFRNVMPIVGNKLYFVSSDEVISTSVCTLALQRGIKNIYVNSDYLSDDLLHKKSAEVAGLIDTRVKQNTFGFPVASFHYQSYNLSKNLKERIPSVIILVLVFIFPLLAVKRKNLIMMTSAAALSGFEIITLLVLQTSIGNMYLLTGIVIASLMSGLALGSAISFRKYGKGRISMTGLLLIIFYISTGLFINRIPEIVSPIFSMLLLLLLITIPALLTGNLFSLMTDEKGSFSDPASVYSADLAGSALGFVLVAGFVVPAFGISLTIILLSTLIFGALLFGTIGNKE